MNTFKEYTHEKTSLSQQGRTAHFQKLKLKHTNHSFIIVGQHHHSFSGALAVEFQNINFTKKDGSCMVIDIENCSGKIVMEKWSETMNREDNACEMVAKSGKQRRQKNDEQDLQLNKVTTNCFQKVITTLPKRKQKFKEVIELLDSPEDISPPQQIILRLPILPIFNCDHLYYTPTFAIPKHKIDQNELFLQFQRKISDSQKQIAADEIMEARPRNKHLYCAICKQYYEEYLGHIRFKIHQDNAKNLTFSQHIKTLQLQMNIGVNWDERKKEMKRLKAKEDRIRKRQQEQQRHQLKEQELKRLEEVKNKQKGGKKQEKKRQKQMKGEQMKVLQQTMKYEGLQHVNEQGLEDEQSRKRQSQVSVKKISQINKKLNCHQSISQKTKTKRKYTKSSSKGIHSSTHPHLNNQKHIYQCLHPSISQSPDSSTHQLKHSSSTHKKSKPKRPRQRENTSQKIQNEKKKLERKANRQRGLQNKEDN